MFGLKLFGKKHPGPNPASAEGKLVIARLNARLQPIGRGEHFEDPLDAALREAGLGEVTGGGTQLADEPAGIEFCDIEVLLADATEVSLDALSSTLEGLGAPKGSKLIFGEQNEERPFGTNEGFALFLNGTDLPPQVYKDCDVNHVVAELDRLLGERGKFMGYYEGSRETALYCYGASFEAMRDAVAPLLRDYPLCAQSRVERIA